MKRLLAVILCLSLLLGCVTVLAETKGAESTTRANVTDTDAPDIISWSFTEKNKTLRPGDTIHVQVRVEDRSEIWSCSAWFYNKSKEKSFSVYMYYDAASDMFKGEYTLQKTDANGEYILTEFDAEDKFGNHVYCYNGEKGGLGKFKLKGAGNSSATLKATVKIKENGKTVKPGDQIHLEGKLQKKYTNAAYMDFRLVREGTNNGMWFGIDFDPSSTKFTSTFAFGKDTPSGKYLLDAVYIYDEYWNTLAYKKISGQSITLTGGSNDKTPPKFSSVSLKEKKKKLTAGDTVHFSVKVKDSSDINYVDAYLNPTSHVWYYDFENKTSVGKTSGYGTSWIGLKYNKSSKKWEGTYTLPEDWPDGQYYLSFSTTDAAGNYAWKEYPKLYINYSSADRVDEGMEDFIYECWYAIWGKAPSDSEVQQYAMPLATGKQKAVNVIKTLVTKAGLSGEAAAEALLYIMQGDVSESSVSKTVNALKTGLDNAIDSLNNAAFRQRCRYWGINAGSLGAKAADIDVASVDVDGGHYTLNGSKATLAGVTDKGITSLVIPDTVSANGKTYKVTKIQGAACKGLAKLASVTIGKNVTNIGVDAFAGCKKLKTVTINTTKIKTVGWNCFGNINSKATIKCPKKKLDMYKKLFQTSGNAPKKVKFK